MNIVLIAWWVFTISHCLITITSWLTYLWWFLFVAYIIKALKTKTQLDRKKRNIIGLKCFIATILGHLGYGIMLNVYDGSVGSNFEWFAVYGIIVIWMIICSGILLFWSGSLLILIQTEVNYSWPFTFLNEKDQVELGQ